MTTERASCVKKKDSIPLLFSPPAISRQALSLTIQCGSINPFRRVIGLVWMSVALCLLLLTADMAAAQRDVRISADVQIKYADDCFAGQDYEAAMAEYKRFIYFFPEDTRVVHARFHIGMSLFHLKDCAAALNQFTAIFDQQGPTPAGVESAWMISRCYARLGDYRSAIDHLAYLVRMTPDEAVADKAWYHIGWLCIETGDLACARATFDRITPSGRQDLNMEGLDAALAECALVPGKRPFTAGILSVVPGGGYLYCGRYRDALIAFFFTSAFIFGAVESFDQDLHVLGGMMSAVGLGFYGGSIYGGINSAHKFNQTRQREFVAGLKKKWRLHLSAGFRDRRIMLGMICPF